MAMKKYELKKDVSMPCGYWRAGKRGTLADFEAIWGKISEFDVNDWFIDLSKKPEPEYTLPEIKQIIDDVFEKRELRSISYKEAAEEVAHRYYRFKNKPS